MLIRASGGRKLAGDTIENLYFAGSDHLIATDYISKARKMSCFVNILL
jgi:hypothetical protein